MFADMFTKYDGVFLVHLPDNAESDVLYLLLRPDRMKVLFLIFPTNPPNRHKSRNNYWRGHADNECDA